MRPFGFFSRKAEPSVAQVPHGLALSVALQAAPIGHSSPFAVGSARLGGSCAGGRRLARCRRWSAPVVVPAVRASQRRACSVSAFPTACGRWLRLSGLGYTARSNLTYMDSPLKTRN